MLVHSCKSIKNSITEGIFWSNRILNKLYSGIKTLSTCIFSKLFFFSFFLVVVMVSAGYWGYSQSKYSLYVCSTKNNMCWGVCYLYPTKVRLRPEFGIRISDFRIRNSDFRFQNSEFGIWLCVFFVLKNGKYLTLSYCLFTSWKGCRNREGGTALALPIFGRSVNSIPTREDRFCPPFTTGTPQNFHLPTSLIRDYGNTSCGVFKRGVQN